MSANGEIADEKPDLVVEDPEDYSQQQRIQQILKSRDWVRESLLDIELNPHLGSDEKESAKFKVVRNYIADLEPLRNMYPSCEAYWTGDFEDEDETFDIGEIDYERRARQKRGALRRHEFKGVKHSVGNMGIDILEIEPKKGEIDGLADYISLPAQQTVRIEYRQEPNAYNTDPTEKFTRIGVPVPASVSNRAFRCANMYVADIGLSATPGAEVEDAVGRYADLMEHGPPEGDAASVRGDED